MDNQSANPRKYMLAQLCFWGVYCVLNLIFAGISGIMSPLMVFIFISLSALLWIVTNIFRSFFKRYACNWSLLKISLQLLWVLPSAAILIQTILSGSLYIVLTSFPPTDTKIQTFSYSNFFVYTTNTCIILALWSVIYLLRAELIKRRNSEIDYWRSQTKLREIELHFLRSQINSHFLFNAINNLRSLILEDHQAARQGLADLATLLRGLMQIDTQTTVSLKEELDWVRGYLALEQLQLENRLQISFNVDESLLDQQLPPLALQTLVENGIKHGIAVKRGGGTLGIHAQVVNETNWTLTVTNPMADAEHQAPEHQGNHIGLQNLRERLILAFDKQAVLQLDFQGNATATITFPLTES